MITCLQIIRCFLQLLKRVSCPDIASCLLGHSLSRLSQLVPLLPVLFQRFCLLPPKCRSLVSSFNPPAVFLKSETPTGSCFFWSQSCHEMKTSKVGHHPLWPFPPCPSTTFGRRVTWHELASAFGSHNCIFSQHFKTMSSVKSRLEIPKEHLEIPK